MIKIALKQQKRNGIKIEHYLEDVVDRGFYSGESPRKSNSPNIWLK
jgi:hypothetical protein